MAAAVQLRLTLRYTTCRMPPYSLIDCLILSTLVICIGPANPEDAPWTINTNPDGERYVTGVCEFDTTAADAIATATVDFVGKGLEAGFGELGSITCEIMLNVLKEAILAGTYMIPGTRQVALASRAVAKGVKLAAKSRGGKDLCLWEEAVAETYRVPDRPSDG
ncbi:hypothetical protein FZEAL_7559 [Fusarium zealandicum]|uniref:Uncharacterized protein n=1 Tax=Fusarium zealandicum TaxID=1053134 RepID=A0A8H4UGA6_9HYPO|nr:hypothetical protein FZEAL_7559 [Fusarium zealandicum]